MQDDSPWKPPADADAGQPAGDRDEPAASPPPPPSTSPAPPPPPPPGGDGRVPSEPPRLAAPAPAASAPAPLVAPPSAGPVTDPEPATAQRSKWVVAGAFVAVIAVVAAGIFAIVNLTGETSAGGSDTPEELGTELLAAVENEDVLGAIELLVPGERRSLGEPFVELIDELQRLDVLAETDLSALDGLDVELSDQSVTARQTNVVDIVNVDMVADVAVTVDGAELPIGSLVTDNLPPEVVTELRGSRSTETDRIDFSLTAIEQDGSWYFSLLHSLAEVARGDVEPEIGIPTEGIGAVGAESPDGAVDLLFDHVESLDVRGLLQVLSPDEAAALQRYAPLFIEDAEALAAEVPLTWRITERDVRIDGNGDAATVFIDALAIEGVAEGTDFSIAFADGCVRASAGGESFEQCTSDTGLDELEELLADAPGVLDLVETVREAFADVEASGLELRQVDGRWYVSPIASVTELSLNFLRALDREEIDAIIAGVEPAVESLPDAIPGLIEEFAGEDLGAELDSVLGDEAGAVTADDAPAIEEAAGGVPDEGVEFDEDPAWVGCYDEVDVAAATSCFGSYVETGEIDPSTVPAVLRFPECGYAEVAWSGDVYSLPDDEFIATVTPASECFRALVDQGVVSVFELPNELVHLECFEGRNWYQVFDDPDYDERYYDCIDQRLDD